MAKVLVLGAGKIGATCAHFLSAQKDYTVTLADASAEQLQRGNGVAALVVDATDSKALTEILEPHDAVINAGPFWLSPLVAEAARGARTHYFDLTEDVANTQKVMALAESAETAFMPQCGLAPGFVSIVAADLAKRFDILKDVQMRVGALPKYPTNALKYNLTWSTDGLINEYCNMAEAVVDGELKEVAALGDVEAFSLDGVTYEAFNTSGGLGTLCHTLQGKVQNLNYKTVRYPGHRDIVKTLLRDLRLGEPDKRALLKQILEAAIPVTTQDVALVFVTVTGEKKGVLTQESYAKKIYAEELHGRALSAIQITTAAAACAAMDLMLGGKLPQRGFLRQEDVALDDFLANRFGHYYLQADDIQTVAAA